jgi:hypothetical protein
MADTTISALTVETTFAADDYIPFDDTSAAATRKATPLGLSAGIIALATAITTGWHATQDHVLYDDNGVTKKSTLPNLMTGLVALTTTSLAGSGIVGTDQLIIGDGTAGAAVVKYTTVTDLTTAIALLGFTLADIPEYADQAAAATGLSGTGRLWWQTATGLLGITIT